MVGTPAATAVLRRDRSGPGESTINGQPNAAARAATCGCVRSARTCGWLVRSAPAVWRSIPKSLLATTSRNSTSARREASEPPRLPGKLRLRSRRSGSRRSRTRKPGTLATGTATIVPARSAKEHSLSSERRMPTPISSSPCTVAVMKTVGPAPPRTTVRGMDTGSAVYDSATLSMMSTVSPSPTRVPAKRRAARVTVVFRRRRVPARRGVTACRGPPPRSAAVTGIPVRSVLDDEVDHGARDVDAGGGLDPFEARRAVHLQHHRTLARGDHVDPGDVQPEHLRGVDRGRRELRLQRHAAGRAAAVEIAAELSLDRLAGHRGDHLPADHDGAKVGAPGLLDEGLDEDVLLQRVHRLEHRLRGFHRLGEDDAGALAPLEQLEDDRRAAYLADRRAHVLAAPGEGGGRDPDVVARQQLQGAELVAALGDRLAVVGREDAHHLELAQHREPIEGDRGADARHDAVEAGDALAVVVDLRTLAGELDHAVQRVEHRGLGLTRAAGFDEPSGRVQAGAAGQDGDLQRRARFSSARRRCQARSRYLAAGSTQKSPSTALRPRIIRKSMPERSVSVR